jgi:hypothetical protein
MKKQIAVTMALALFAGTSFAQIDSSLNTSTYRSGYSSEGVRVSILKPNYEFTGKVKFAGDSFEGTATPDSIWGVAVGYAQLPIQELGWTANLGMLEEKTDDVSMNMLRVDGNLAFAFNQFLNIKGGINIMKITTGKGTENLNAGIGYQASLGLQLTKNLGIDLGYSEVNTSGKTPVTSGGTEIGKADVEVKMKGVEAGFNATF